MSRASEHARRSGPRFSIVPPAAAFDLRLDPIDVRVLMVFGAAIDKSGWCSRSQVKMARELAIGRATLQRAIRRLCDAGYLEQQRLLDKDGGDRAHKYRVFFESSAPPPLDDEHLRAERDADDSGDEDEDDAPAPLPTSGQGGAHQRAGGARAMERAGGAHAMERAPIRTTSSERPLPNESEREGAGGREGKASDGPEIAEFYAVWPTAAVDDPARMEREWAMLNADERRAAITGAAPYLEARRAAKRTTTPAGETYLRQRRWVAVADVAVATAKAKAGGPAGYLPPFSKLWWAGLLWRIDRGDPRFELRKMLNFATQNRIGWRPPDEARPAVEALAETLVPVFHDAPQGAAWRAWLKDRGLDVAHDGEAPPMFLRAQWPPGGAETADEAAREMARG